MIITQFLSVFLCKLTGQDIVCIVDRKLKECRALEGRVIFKMSRQRFFSRADGIDLYNDLKKKHREVEHIVHLGGASAYYTERELMCTPFNLILLEAEKISYKPDIALPSRQKNIQLQCTLKEMDSDWKAYVKDVTEEHIDTEVFEMYQNKRDSLVKELEGQQKLIRDEEELQEQERLKEAHITAFNRFYHY